MITVHDQIVDALRLASVPGQAPQLRQFHRNCAARLLRMFLLQMEMLKRLRAGGPQKMVVEHVHGNEGAEAMVDNIRTQGGDAAKRNER
jgi:hypothetical protein